MDETIYNEQEQAIWEQAYYDGIAEGIMRAKVKIAEVMQELHDRAEKERKNV